MGGSYRYKLGFVGAGNMAEAITRGVLAANLCAPGEMMASDPIEARRRLFGSELGIATTDDNTELVSSSSAILLAIKPQEFRQVLGKMAGHVRPDQTFISIMAGVSTGAIEAQLAPIAARVVRVMPNLLIAVGAGVAGVAKGRYAIEEDLALAQRIFDSAGSSLVLDEPQIDAVTAVSGSGPAYFFFFVEAITEGGVRAGLSREQAEHLAKHTALGAAKMMLERSESPAELREKVTSKGGTTQAAITSMTAAGVPEAIADGVVAAWKRAQELGQ